MPTGLARKARGDRSDLALGFVDASGFERVCGRDDVRDRGGVEAVEAGSRRDVEVHPTRVYVLSPRPLAREAAPQARVRGFAARALIRRFASPSPAKREKGRQNQ